MGIEKKSIFDGMAHGVLGERYLFSKQAPIDARAEVSSRDGLLVLSGEAGSEDDIEDNVCYDGMRVWVKDEHKLYCYYDNGYTAITNTVGKNPRNEGWFENVGTNSEPRYALTSDDEPAHNKTYYLAPIDGSEHWREFQVMSSRVEQATSADYLRTPRNIQGHAFNGQDNVESGFFYPEILNLTIEEQRITVDGVERERTIAEQTEKLKEKMLYTTQSGFYYGAYPDGSGQFGLVIEKIGDNLYKRTLTERNTNGVIVRKTAIGKANLDANNPADAYPVWYQQNPSSVARILNITPVERENSNDTESGIRLPIVFGEISEKWLFMHVDLPVGVKFVRDNNGDEYDFPLVSTAETAQPYYIKLTNDNGIKTAVAISTRADYINHGLIKLSADFKATAERDRNNRIVPDSQKYGLVKLSDVIDNDTNDAGDGVAATPKAVANLNATLSAALAVHAAKQANWTDPDHDITTPQPGHVLLTDEIDPANDKNAGIAASPKAVQAGLDAKADLTDLATEFDPTAAYAVGDYVTHNGDLYRCIKPHRDETAFETYAELIQERFGGWDMEHNYADGEFVKGNKNSQQQTPVRKLLHPIVFEEIEVEEFSLTGTYEAGKYINWANSAIYLTTQSLDILNLVDFFNSYVYVVDGETTTTIFSYSNSYNIGKTVKIGDKVYRFQRKYQASTIRQILDQNCTLLRLLGNVDTWFSKANFSIINGDVFDNATDLYQSGRFFKYVGETYTNHSTVEQDSIAQFAGLESAEAGKYFYKNAEGEFDFTDIRIFSLYRFKESYPIQFSDYFAKVTVCGELTGEAGTRAANDTTLQNNLNEETVNRVQADITLQGNIDGEAATRENADNLLNEKIENHANNKATGAVSAHVRLSDSEYQPELDAYEHVAATPKAVSKKANTTTLAAEFDPTATYAVGDLVTRSGNLYRCIDDYADPNSFETNFEAVGDNATIDIETPYVVGDFVVVGHNLYRCKSALDLPNLLEKIEPVEFGSCYNYAAGDIVEWLGNYYQINDDVTLFAVLKNYLHLWATNSSGNYSTGFYTYNPHTTYDSHDDVKIYDEVKNVWYYYYTRWAYALNPEYLSPAVLTNWLAANATQLDVVDGFELNSSFNELNVVKLNDFIYRLVDTDTALNIAEHFEQTDFIEVATAPAGEIPALNIGSAYQAGDWISDSGNNYQCINSVDFGAVIEAAQPPIAFGSRYNYDKGDIVTWNGSHYLILENCTLGKLLTDSGFFDKWSSFLYEENSYPILDITKDYSSYGGYASYSTAIYGIWDERQNGWIQYQHKHKSEYVSGVGFVYHYFNSANVTEWLEANSRRLIFAEWNIQTSFDAQTWLMESGVIYRLAAGAPAFSVADYFTAPEATTPNGALTVARGAFIRRASVIYRSRYNYPATFAGMFEIITVAGQIAAEAATRQAAIEAEKNKRSAADVALEEMIAGATAHCLNAIDNHADKKATGETVGHVTLTDEILNNNLDSSFGVAVTPQAVIDFVNTYVIGKINEAIQANNSVNADVIPSGNTYHINATSNYTERTYVPNKIRDIKDEYYYGGDDNGYYVLFSHDIPQQLYDGDKVIITYQLYRLAGSDTPHAYDNYIFIKINDMVYRLSTQGLNFNQSSTSDLRPTCTITYVVRNGILEVVE
jgi:hypothetical protein